MKACTSSALVMTCGGRYRPLPEMTTFFMAGVWVAALAAGAPGYFLAALFLAAVPACSASDMPSSTPLTIAV